MKLMASLLKIVSLCLLGLFIACSDGDKPSDNQDGLTLDQEDSVELEPERSVIKGDTSNQRVFNTTIEEEIRQTKDRIAAVEKILANTELPAAEKDAYIREIETLKKRLPELEKMKKKADKFQEKARSDSM